jgi:hypothetical protein
MTLAQLQRRLRRAGARAELVGGRCVIRGWARLSRTERAVVAQLRPELEAALRRPLAAAPQAPAGPPADRRVVGQRSHGSGDGRLVWSPIYADEVKRAFNPSVGGLSVLQPRPRAATARPVSAWPRKEPAFGCEAQRGNRWD